MRPIVASLFASIDGYATDAPGVMSWVLEKSGPEFEQYITDDMQRADAMILGRVTYEEFASYWPTVTEAESRNADRMNGIEKIVFSETLEEATWSNSRIVKGDLAEELGKLKQQPGGPLNVTGSVSLIRSMIQAGVLDRLNLLVFPTILGHAGGKAIFDGYDQTDLKLVGATPMDGTSVRLEYAAS